MRTTIHDAYVHALRWDFPPERLPKDAVATEPWDVYKIFKSAI